MAKLPGFSIEKLGQLHQGGQISSAEYKMLHMKAMGITGITGEVNSSLSHPPYGDDEE